MKPALLLLLAGMVSLHAQTFPSPNTTHPTVIYKVDPEYTKEATKAQLEGSVSLTTVIGIDGLASGVTVVKGLGKGLDEKAIECLQKWRFKPATRDGEAVPVKAAVEINFRLH